MYFRADEDYRMLYSYSTYTVLIIRRPEYRTVTNATRPSNTQRN